VDQISSPLGIALIVIGAFVAIKAIKTVVKLAMVVVIAIGLYLWFGVGDTALFGALSQV
jgi:hypothetical protein